MLVSSAMLWRRQWHPTAVLLPGKSHGRRSLVGCSPWGCKESDTTNNLPQKQRRGGSVKIAMFSALQLFQIILMCACLSFIKRKSNAAAAASKSLQSCLTLWDPMDCSLPGSSAHGIFQARVLEWVAIAFSEKVQYLNASTNAVFTCHGQQT